MRIAVIGPQNTGKSTFIKDFLKAFPHYITPTETYRDAIKKHKLKINQLSGENSQRIIRDHMQKIFKENIKNKKVIFDRTMIDNYVYTKIQKDSEMISEEFARETYMMMLKELKKFDLYLFIPTQLGVLLKDDKLRDTDKSYIDKVNKEFMDVLFVLIKDYSINVRVLSGDRKERIKKSTLFIS
jgi:nicotinamide riboside kinase